MKCELTEFSQSDGNTNVVYQWIPETVSHVVVLSHGMAEHAARYARFAEFLGRNNVALIAEDHRGHGKTGQKAQAAGTGSLSVLAESDGFNRVSQDIYEELLYARRLFPGACLVLFGHSFGSFIAQNVIEQHGDSMDKAVLCGTAGPRPLTIALAKCAGALVLAVQGREKAGRLLNFLTFGSSNARIKERRTEFDWLSRDSSEVDLYVDDPLCGIPATNGFLYDIYCGLSQIHRKKRISMIPKELPVLIAAGTADPVGSYGKTVKRLYRCYRKAGMKKVSLSLYEDARHELLNETNRDIIMEDMLKFIKG
ncbi:MAG: alpha/beta hydrolase [Treponema sp.]|nr:alpha/beta hydrolase [Treponema sp.]